jgi:hypothetical protein
MRRFFTVMTAVFAVVAFSSVVLAQAAPQAAKPAVEKVAKTDQAKPAAKAPAAKKATAMKVVGKIAKYDDATKTLTVTTKKGDEDFMLGADAKITVGVKAATATDLAKDKSVTVTYTEADGKMTASKVQIAVEKAAPAKKAPEAKK